MKSILAFFRGKTLSTSSVPRETPVNNTQYTQSIANMNAAHAAGKDLQDVYAYYR